MDLLFVELSWNENCDFSLKWKFRYMLNCCLLLQLKINIPYDRNLEFSLTIYFAIVLSNFKQINVMLMHFNEEISCTLGNFVMFVGARLCIIIKCCMPNDFFIYWDYIIFSKIHSFVVFRGITLSSIPHYKWGSWVYCNPNLETIILIFVNMWYVIVNLYIGLNCIIIFVNFQTYANINILGYTTYMCLKATLNNNSRNKV
jgi:hypothetical protein